MGNNRLDVVDLTESRDFRLKEYDRVSGELLAQLEEAWRLEKFAIGGSAALMAWLITNPVSERWAWLLPLFFFLACAFRFSAAMLHIVFRLGAYIKVIERTFVGKSGWMGWENWFRGKGFNQTIAHGILWLALIALAGSVSYLGMNQRQRSAAERYKVAHVIKGATSAMEIEKVLNRESEDGWTLVTIYNNIGDEVLVFSRK